MQQTISRSEAVNREVREISHTQRVSKTQSKLTDRRIFVIVVAWFVLMTVAAFLAHTPNEF